MRTLFVLTTLMAVLAAWKGEAVYEATRNWLSPKYEHSDLEAALATYNNLCSGAFPAPALNPELPASNK